MQTFIQIFAAALIGAGTPTDPGIAHPMHCQRQEAPTTLQAAMAPACEPEQEATP